MTLKIRTDDFDMRTTLELLQSQEVKKIVLESKMLNEDFNRLLNKLGFFETSTTGLIKTYEVM